MSDNEEGGNNNSSSTATGKPLTRKERQKLEKQQKFQQELAALEATSASGGGGGLKDFTVNYQGRGGANATPANTRDISLKKVSISINTKTLFSDADISFTAGSRYGLMGPNGRGKTTLLKLIANRELPVPEGLDFLLVEQEQDFHESGLTAVAAVIQSHKLMASYQAEAEKLQEKEDDMSDKELARLQFLENELSAMSSDRADSKARRILFGLGFPTEWHDRPTTSFSGGWRKRIALASSVFIEPDVLMLDEPTNHLDLNAVIWLEQYLDSQYNETAKKKKILIVVSHDAGFLDSVCSHMVLIENRRLNYFAGGYPKFAYQVEQMHVKADKKYEDYKKLIASKKASAKGSFSKEDEDEWVREQIKIGRMDEAFLIRRRDYVVKFPFPTPPSTLRDEALITFDNVSFGYPGCPELFSGITFSLWGDTRVTLCGPNGVGKTTILNLITGALTPTKGTVTVNRRMRIGRYNQHFVDTLPMDKTPVQLMMGLGVENEGAARGMLGKFGLEGISHGNRMEKLSGGQKARVAFAAIAAGKPHMLLLDEPTNHLDVEAIEALCVAVSDFEGGVFVVTHDSRLIQETELDIWVASNHSITPFSGDLDAYKKYITQMVEDEEARQEAFKKPSVKK